MSATTGFIIFYILTGIFGTIIAYDIKHSENMSFFLITAHILLFISDFYWTIYYGFKLWVK